jgi:predicted deacylase
MKHTLIAMLMLFSTQQMNAQELNLQSNKLNEGIHDFSLKLEDQDKNAILPIRVIKGKNEGPVFTIIAGVHGYEYPPIIAVQELMNEIDYTTLKGTIVIVPIANTASFNGRSAFYNPIDGRNLNTTFPGKENGTITEQIAYQITNKIIPVSDVLLDIHAGDASEDLIPFICYYNAEDYAKQTAEAKRLSENSGFENVVSYSYTLTKSQPALYAFKQAVQDGKVALSIESGKLGNVQKESVAEIKNSVYLMLKDLKMYTKQNLKTVKKIINYNQQAYIKSDVQGIFYSNLKAGDDVKEGQVVGYVTDFFGKKIKEFKSPVTGKILYKIGTPPINPNETVFCIAYKN